MKQCSKCKIVKPLEEYHKDKSSKNGLRSICKECRRPISKIYYLENKEKINKNNKRYHEKNKEKINERRKRYYLKNKEKFIENNKCYNQDHKTFVYAHKTSCAICKETNKVVLNFHHRNKTEKLFTIGDGGKHSKKNLLKEMAKCEVLCENHHKEFHHYERTPLETPQDLLDKYTELGLVFGEKKPRKKMSPRFKTNLKTIESFNLPCHVCGEDRTHLIDFHHLNPQEKEHTISHIRHHSLEKVLKEIEKTVCLCANCHRIYHNIYGYNEKLIARPEAYRRLDALKGAVTA